MPTKLASVFVVGGQPTVTYVSRDEQRLEEKLREYIEYGHTVLSVTGATKSGKTVLCRRLISPADHVWVQGGDLRSEMDLWRQIVHRLKLPSQSTTGAESKSKATVAGGFNLGELLKAIIPFRLEGGYENHQSELSTNTYDHDIRLTALNGIKKTKQILVIDDFHFVDEGTQEKIIKSLKGPISEGVRVVLVSIPHRGNDAQRVCADMQLRVYPLRIEPWTDQELRQIATEGFRELNVRAVPTVIRTLVSEARGSPHLMQDFCRRLCQKNSVSQRMEEETSLRFPNKDKFFSELTEAIGPDSIKKLVQGKGAKAREQRALSSGETLDIYGAVLRAVANKLPAEKLRGQNIYDEVKRIVTQNPPQKHEVTRVLERMSEIAKNEIEGQPIIEWDKKNAELHLIDPFFAFYLRWGDWRNEIN